MIPTALLKIDAEPLHQLRWFPSPANPGEDEKV
jgi:hypothetical protein